MRPAHDHRPAQRHRCAGLLLALATSAATGGPAASTPAAPDVQPFGSATVTVVKPSDIVPPRLLPPCPPGQCRFAGQTVTMLLPRSVIATPVLEVREEFEAATGATLKTVQVGSMELFDHFYADVTHRTGRYDSFLASAWWLGELVAGDHLLPYDKYHKDPRFPQWDIEDVLPAPRALLSYGDRKYMVANDHDGQVLYYRRDLLADAQHKKAFQQKFHYPLQVPRTWQQFRDMAEYFNGQDLNGDGVPDHGLSLPLKASNQGMFHFMSLSASFVIGPSNPRLYWFDPQSMQPLIESPGHVRALQTLVDLVQFGPREMLGWEPGRSWDHFLAGRAALSFSWGDLGALAQQQGSQVKGKVGTAALPGSTEYYSIASGRWMRTELPNRVGNTTGGSWAGVIAKHSKAPAATYFLLALLATKDKSMAYAARGSDGIDPGRRYHFLPPDGSARVKAYLQAGWDEADVRDYLHAYHDTFSNPLQLPYLRIPGTYSYWQAFNQHLAEAAAGRVSPQAALKATALSFEETTLRLGRDAQRRAYRASLGL
ncbi:ABC transporter substrate-binding protein [Aquabacterium sp.]|uniref:ABC transporter substrate-binding protein n=1 Tax=Aquabacterium sp. TaxID=1872578 RepID=UPI002CCE20A5|nr:extracellular solute-binding protein [Aquabacterium sp.]HSW08304.1 extracellular solute-binding protein [Aquabacterium sp.]